MESLGLNSPVILTRFTASHILISVRFVFIFYILNDFLYFNLNFKYFVVFL